MASPRRPASRSHARRARPTPKAGKGRPARAASRGRLTRFEMPSARAAVPPAVDRILNQVEDVGLSESQRADLATALSEALANAAIHGNKLSTEAPVFVAVKVGEEEATIDIRDCGRGFDHAHVGDPTAESQVLMPGGRGVFLMKHLVDRLEYNRSGNRVRLVVQRR